MRDQALPAEALAEAGLRAQGAERRAQGGEIRYLYSV